MPSAQVLHSDPDTLVVRRFWTEDRTVTALTRRPIGVSDRLSGVPSPYSLGIIICSSNPHTETSHVQRPKGVNQEHLRVIVNHVC